MIITPIKVGIVFSGGIAKGAYQAGFMMALLKHKNLAVTSVSAASIGALNGYALSAGKINEAVKLWRTVNIRNKRQVYRQLLKEQQIFDYIDSIYSVDDKLQIPLHIVCASIYELKPVYILLNNMSDAEIGKFLKASVSIPFVMEPIVINGLKYCDGAVLDNTPISPLSLYQNDLIISVQFDDNIQGEFKNMPCPVLYFNLQNKSHLTENFALDYHAIERMINYGYEASDDLFTLIENSFSDYKRFMSLIERYNSGIKRKGIAADKLIRTLNKISSIR